MTNFINEKMLEELTREFQKLRSCIFVSVQGMSAMELNNLRAGFGEWNIKFQVVKNQIAKRALKANKIEGVESFLEGPTAIALGDGESAIRAAKVVVEVMKTSKTLVIKGGYLEGDALDPDKVKWLAEIPSKEELYSSILGGIVSLMSAPVSLVDSLRSMPAKLASAYADKKEN